MQFYFFLHNFNAVINNVKLYSFCLCNVILKIILVSQDFDTVIFV